MPRIFVSHSTQDRQFVECEILPTLAEHGIEPWYSKDDIAVADEWERRIVAALKECDWFLVVMSPRSASSKWVKAEVGWAFEHKNDQILPVLAEPCDRVDFHLMMPMLQHIDFASDDKLAKVLLGTACERIKRHAAPGLPLEKPRPLPEPEPPTPEEDNDSLFTIVLTSLILVLFAVCCLSLYLAYWSGSEHWDRMYSIFKRHPTPEDLRDPAGAYKWGFWVELGRSVLCLIFTLVWIVGYLFRKEASALFFGFGTKTPWRQQPPAPGREPPPLIQALCLWGGRVFFIALVVFITDGVLRHNREVAPVKLTLCEGYRDRWRLENPKGKDYETNLVIARKVYNRYLYYSVANFGVMGPVVFAVSIYATVLGLVRIAVQNGNLEKVAKNARRRQGASEEVLDCFARVRDSLRTMFGNQCWLVCFLAIAACYQVWFDRYNLSPDANEFTETALLVLLFIFLIFLLLYLGFHSRALGLTSRSIDKSLRAEFYNENKISALLNEYIEIMFTIRLTIAFAVLGVPLHYCLVEWLGWL